MPEPTLLEHASDGLGADLKRGPGSKPAGRTRRAVLMGLLAIGVLEGCGSNQAARRVNLPPPSESAVVGPSDVFTLEIVGEKELPKEFQVAADGTVDLPYIHSLKVDGLEAPEIAALVRSKLIERKILTDPSVIVRIREYNSRRITVLGQVTKPGSYAYVPGMTLIQAISMGGGLTAIGNADSVNITRRAKTGKTYTALVSVGRIIEGEAADIPLQAGDQIFVHERLF